MSHTTSADSTASETHHVDYGASRNSSAANPDSKTISSETPISNGHGSSFQSSASLQSADRPITCNRNSYDRRISHTITDRSGSSSALSRFRATVPAAPCYTIADAAVTRRQTTIITTLNRNSRSPIVW